MERNSPVSTADKRYTILQQRLLRSRRQRRRCVRIRVCWIRFLLFVSSRFPPFRSRHSRAYRFRDARQHLLSYRCDGEEYEKGNLRWARRRLDNSTRRELGMGAKDAAPPKLCFSADGSDLIRLWWRSPRRRPFLISLFLSHGRREGESKHEVHGCVMPKGRIAASSVIIVTLFITTTAHRAPLRSEIELAPSSWSSATEQALSLKAT